VSAPASRSVQTLLDALEVHNCSPKKQGDGWTARCPAHADSKASLSIGQGGDGRALVHCHASCKFDSVLFSIGLDTAVLFEPDRKEKPTDSFDRDIEATYDYTDLAGKLLYQVVRFKGKNFRQRRPDPKGGWIWTVKGVDRVPYCLPLLTDAVKRGLLVYVCYSEDTEVLTPDGWARFPNLSEAATVAQWATDGSISFVVPLARQMFHYAGEMINIHSDFSDLLVTPDHRCITWLPRCEPKIVRAGDFHGNRKFPIAGHSEGSMIGPTTDQARLLAAWQADGVWPDRGYRGGWNLKKERKKERIRSLLRACSIAFKEQVFDSTPEWTYITVDLRTVPWLEEFLPEKTWTWGSLAWPLATRRAALHELAHWDGDSPGKKGIRFFTEHKVNADVISAMAAISGMGSIVRADNRPSRPEQKTQYVVSLNDRDWRHVLKPPTQVPYDGLVYCLTVPSGFLMTRRNGKTTVAGNCEGEKDADTLNRLGNFGQKDFVATCNSGGAGKWEPTFAHYLAGARVVVVQDKDDPGRKHAKQVADSLRGLAKTVRIVQAKEGKDATDHVLAGYGVEDFVPAEEEADPVDPEAAISYRMSDTGNAQRFADQHHGAARYVHTWNSWFLWTGRHWQEDQTGAVQGLVGATIESMWNEARSLTEDARLRLLRHTLATEANRRRNAILEIAGSDPRLATTNVGFDLNGWLLNARNGTIDLTNGTIREHRQSDYLTHCLDMDYEPAAECPLWMDFLIQVMDGNQDLVDFLRRAVGYSLTGSTQEQVFFMLYGTGSNGKSTFLEILRLLLGALAKNADFSTFIHREQESVRSDIARMRAARLVTAAETEGDRRFSETILKTVTGGDTVTARQLYSKEFEFKPSFKLWLAANHRPVIRGSDHAIWRRVRLIPFTVTIADAEQDQHLVEKLREELPGILAWAIRGCLEWQRDRLGAPEGVTEAVSQYREDMDSIGPFVEECCKLGPDFRVGHGDLMRAWLAWAEKNGGPRYSAIGFANIVRDRVPGVGIVKRPNGRFWEGIGLLDDRQLFDGREAAGGE
jgi:putative DNA primase/helicase